ncbi:MAG TPA: hypothetical protein VGL40_10560 [Bacillota bacterium]
MSLRPVDIQTVLPKSTEVAKVKQVQDNDPQSRQVQFATQFQHRVERRQQQVTASPQARDSRVDPDARGRKGREGEARDGREGEAGPGEAEAKAGAGGGKRPGPGPGRGKKLDITI